MSNSTVHLQQGVVLWTVASYGDQRHPPGTHWWNDNRDRQPFSHIVVQYIESGCMTFIEAGRSTRVGPNMAAVFGYGSDTQYGLPPDATESCRTHWIVIEGAGLMEHVQTLHSRFGAVFAFDRDKTFLSELRELMKAAAPQRGRDVLLIAGRVQRLVLRLFEFGLRSRYAAQTPVERAVDELMRDPLSTMSLKEVAQRHDISREHLTRLFRRRTGRSPGQHLAAARLERAITLLRDSHLPIASVARQSGYHSVHTMSRQIRTATGRSPTTLRLDAERRR